MPTDSSCGQHLRTWGCTPLPCAAVCARSAPHRQSQTLTGTPAAPLLPGGPGNPRSPWQEEQWLWTHTIVHGLLWLSQMWLHGKFFTFSPSTCELHYLPICWKGPGPPARVLTPVPEPSLYQLCAIGHCSTGNVRLPAADFSWLPLSERCKHSLTERRKTSKRVTSDFCLNCFWDLGIVNCKLDTGEIKFN